MWRERFSTLRIRRTSTDFFNTCTEPRNQIIESSSGEKRDALVESCRLDRVKATQEYKIHMVLSDKYRKPPSKIEVLETFYFAGKALLPAIKLQQGQLYFVTGLKFHLFASTLSNLNIYFLYVLPEGFWQNSKTSND